MRTSIMLAAAAAISVLSSMSMAAPVTISPTETDATAPGYSKDTFFYSGGANSSYGDFAYLGTSNAVFVLGPPGTPGTLFDTSIGIEFPLAGVTLAPGEHAILGLYARSNAGTPFAGFTADPSATGPVALSAYTNITPFSESDTYTTKPSFNPAAVALANVDGVGKYITLDITSTVQAWLNGTIPNYGLTLRQPVTQNSAGFDVVTTFDSANATNRPYLQIVAPEPTTLAALAGAGVMALRRRLR